MVFWEFSTKVICIDFISTTATQQIWKRMKLCVSIYNFITCICLAINLRLLQIYLWNGHDTVPSRALFDLCSVSSVCRFDEKALLTRAQLSKRPPRFFFHNVKIYISNYYSYTHVTRTLILLHFRLKLQKPRLETQPEQKVTFDYWYLSCTMREIPR